MQTTHSQTSSKAPAVICHILAPAIVRKSMKCEFYLMMRVHSTARYFACKRVSTEMHARFITIIEEITKSLFGISLLP